MKTPTIETYYSDIVTYGVRDMWGKVDLPSAIERADGGVVFVIDSGVSALIDDIDVNQILSRSWITGEAATSDGVGHGTHIAGIIAAKANNAGIVGVAPGAEVVSLKVVDNNGVSAPYQSFVEAVEYVMSVIDEQDIPLHKTVVNFSMSAPASPEIEQVVRKAANKGIRFSVSSGNIGADVDYRTPANGGDHPNIYTVGAADRFGFIPDWSNWDVSTNYDEDDVDGVAAGVDVLSYSSAGTLIEQSGSSMAAAFVAGGLLIGDIVTGSPAKALGHGYTEPALQVKNIENISPDSKAISTRRLNRSRFTKTTKTKSWKLISSHVNNVMEGTSYDHSRLQSIIQSLDNVADSTAHYASREFTGIV